MDTAHLIAAIMLFLIIARGYARPLDTSQAPQDGSHAEEKKNDIVPPVKPALEEPAGISVKVVHDMTPETSKASMENEKTLSSKAFTGEDSVDKNIASSSSSDSADKNIALSSDSADKNIASSSSSDSADKNIAPSSSDSTDKIIAPSSDSVAQNIALSSLDADKNVAPSSDSADKNVAPSSSDSTDKNIVLSASDSADKNIAPSSSDSADKIITSSSDPADQNTALSSSDPADKNIASSDSVDKIIASSSDSAQQPVDLSISTKLQTTEHHTPSTLLMQEHASEDKFDGISKTQHSFTVDTEVRTNNVMKLDNDVAITQAIPATIQPISASAKDTSLLLHDEHALHAGSVSTTGMPNSTQLSNNTDISEEVSPTKTIEIEAEGAEASSNKGQKASSSDWLITAVTVAVAMDGIVKAFSSSSESFKDTASSRMPLSTSLSEGQLPASSFMDASISESMSSPSLSPSTELPDSPFVDTKILKDESISPTSASTQTLKKIPVSTSDDTKTTKDSSLSTISLILPLAQVTATSFVDTKAAKDSLVSTSWSQALTKPPVSSVADTRILNKSPSPISNDLNSLMASPASPLPQVSAELPTSSSVDTKILKDPCSPFLTKMSLPTSSDEMPGHFFGNTLGAKAVSSPAEANVLRDPSFPPTLSLVQKLDEPAASSLEDGSFSKDSPSPLPLSQLAAPPVPAETSLPSFADRSNPNAAENVPLNSFKNDPLLTSSSEKLAKEKRDAADLTFTGMRQDMEVAETMVFRPVYSYRQDSARRRVLRSPGEPRNYL